MGRAPKVNPFAEPVVGVGAQIQPGLSSQHSFGNGGVAAVVANDGTLICQVRHVHRAYRLRTRSQSKTQRFPLLPRLPHRRCMPLWQPEPLRVFICDEHIAIAIQAPQQHRGIMREPVVHRSERLFKELAL